VIRGSATYLTLVFALLGAAIPASAVAQTFQGRVLQAEDDLPIPTALVRLLDEAGEQLAISIADSSGFYRVQAPEPGVYRLEAARIGFENFETPLLSATVADRTYPIDLVMRTDPYNLPGFMVETNRVSDAEADRQVRLMIGISIASLRFRPIGFEQIQSHVERAHSLGDLIRGENTAGLLVFYDSQGPCFSLRARGCLPVYLNGFRLERDFVDATPLDMIYRIVLVTPTDGSSTYPSGAVLLYTEAWLK